MSTTRRLFPAIIPVVAAVLHLLLAFRADAQDPAPKTATDERLLLQEIPSVYAASKYEQKVTEAPSSVSIITAEEIKKYGYRTLADILRSVRSLTVAYDRNYSYVGVRGFTRTGITTPASSSWWTGTASTTPSTMASSSAPTSSSTWT